MTLSQAAILAFPAVFPVMLVVSLIAASAGLKKYVYFISIGYGFSVAALAATVGIAYFRTLGIINAIQLVLLAVYGVRLGAFLLVRELNSASYRKEIKSAGYASGDMNFFIKLIIWLACAFLYVTQVSPALYRAMADQSRSVQAFSFWSLFGVVLMALAVLLEAAADLQKSRAKKLNPNRFCDSGLFKIVRCPNYFAETLFWTALAVSGADSYKGWLQLAVVLFGYICIVYIMLGSTKRLEGKQDSRYGGDPKYRSYKKRTPILIPFVPVMSLQKLKYLK
jgi:steroid 5-alpha reductase family enzyme